MIDRAVVLIGVARTGGGLPELQAVSRGVTAMRHWATGQGLSDEAVSVLDDEAGPVTASAVRAAIAVHVTRGTLRQIVVYFAGHGVNTGGTELWLLSGAPTDPNEAINVASSVLRAKRCGVPHVVLVSDACRTAPTTLQALSVSGSVAFPNLPPSPAGAGRVDVFYACSLGDPAFEFRDPADSSRAYTSAYTEVLTKALSGEPPQVRSPATDQGGSVDLVRPWPLQRALPGLVTDRLVEAGLFLQISQTPEAEITSDPEVAWVSRLPPSAGAQGRGPGDRRTTLADLAREEVLSTGGRRPTHRGPAPKVPGAAELRRAVDAAQPTDAADGAGRGPGLTVRGGALRRAWTRSGALDVDDDAVRAAPDGPATEVLVDFDEDAGCAVLPLLSGYAATVTLDEGRLVDLAYRPAAGHVDTARLEEARQLHAGLSGVARVGLLTALRRAEVTELVERGRLLLDVDPSLAVLVGFAAALQGRDELLDLLQHTLRDRLGAGLLDLAVLGSSTGSGPTLRFPLLSRTWALAPAVPDTLPPLVPLPSRPSLWSTFGAEQFDSVRTVLTREG